MDNYQIVTDEKLLKQFIDWLPDLKTNETFYGCLFARKKYVINEIGLSNVTTDKAQLKRFTGNKQNLFDKIKQLECPLGSYYQKQTQVPQEALALYITVNPRCLEKANKNSIKKLIDLAFQPYNGFNPHNEVLSEIQKAKSRTVFVTFDFDMSKSKFNDMYYSIDFINCDAMTVIETRGGFHLLVSPDKVSKTFQKDWYVKMENHQLYYSDDHLKGDIMLPVPGTYQGGFTPNFKFKNTI